MDFTDALKAGGASATILAIVGIGLKILQTFCGHRLRSECCGREGTVGVSVEDITPKGPRPSLVLDSVAVELPKIQSSLPSSVGTSSAIAPPMPAPPDGSPP